MSKLEPVAVDVDQNQVMIDWSDGKQKIYPAKDLRAACCCAHCVSETTGERLLDASKIKEDITITHAEPVGNYALTFEFSDFHKTGIYTYEMLARLV